MGSPQVPVLIQHAMYIGMGLVKGTRWKLAMGINV